MIPFRFGICNYAFVIFPVSVTCAGSASFTNRFTEARYAKHIVFKQCGKTQP
jgi:hypothetical protein